MVKDFTKEDIPVLGRLVSISEDNTVANAEQIWDAKKDQSIQDTVDDISAEIVQLKQSGGLSQEYKNILNWLVGYTTLSSGENDCLIDHDVAINYTDTRHALGRPPSAALTIQSENVALRVTGTSFLDTTIANGQTTFYGNIHADTVSATFDTCTTDLLYVNDETDFNGPAHFWASAVFEDTTAFYGDITFDSTSIHIQDLDGVIFPEGNLEYLLQKASQRSQNYVLTYGQPVNINEVTEVINNGGQVSLLIDSSSENTQIRLTRHSLGAPGIRMLLFVNSGADDDCFIHNIICWAEDQLETNNGWYESEYYVNPDHEWIEEELTGKQETLVSGENIKTINGQSLLGSGNISITGGGGNGNVVDDDYVHTDNNFTNAEKSKLANIAAGAEVNVQSDWVESNSSSDAYIKNKPTDLGDFTNNAHYLKQGDIVAGNITSTDIQNWNNKADAATTLSGYNIPFDTNYFWESPTAGFTFIDQYVTNHPVRMTVNDDEWTTAGDNKVPTVAAVYDKFLAKDDSTVVKTTGNQNIGGTKTFTTTPVVTGLRASGNDIGGNSNANGEKLFATNGTITTLKTVNGNSLFGTGNISIANSNFTAPTNNVAGTTGLVPAPAAGTQNYILTADGWKSPEELGYVTRQQVTDMINEVLGWESSYISVEVHSNYPGTTTTSTARILCVTNRISGEKYILTTDGTTRGFIYYMVVGTTTTEWTVGDNSQYDFEYPENYVNDTQYGLSGVKAYSQFAYMFN